MDVFLELFDRVRQNSALMTNKEKMVHDTTRLDDAHETHLDDFFPTHLSFLFMSLVLSIHL
jgi:hypothetical protein